MIAIEPRQGVTYRLIDEGTLWRVATTNEEWDDGLIRMVELIDSPWVAPATYLLPIEDFDLEFEEVCE